MTTPKPDPPAYPGRERRGASSDLVAYLRRMASGDEQAFEAFYTATSRAVHGLTLRILRDHQRAEEATADVYLMVWRRAADFDDRKGDPRVWLMTITRSRAIDRLRSEMALAPWEQAATAESWVSVPPTPRAIEYEGVHRALASLPSAQRETLELAYFRGLSQSEIAAELGQPLGTIKTRTRLALQRMRSILHEEEVG